jgi:hypothetical protein
MAHHLDIVDMRNNLPMHPTKHYKDRPSPYTHIAIHHSLTSGGSAEAFARFHIQEHDWPGIGYAYVVHPDGKIEWCHEFNTWTYHVGTHNKYTLGIVNIGNFNQTHPTEEQWTACLYLTARLAMGIPPKDVKGHQEYDGYDWKLCPGVNWDMIKFREELEGLLNV